MTESSTSSVVYEVEKGQKVEAEKAPAPARDKRPSVSFNTAADHVLQVSSAELEGLEAAMMEVEGRMVGCGLMSHPLTACHCSRLDYGEINSNLIQVKIVTLHCRSGINEDRRRSSILSELSLYMWKCPRSCLVVSFIVPIAVFIYIAYMFSLFVFRNL